MIPTSELRIGNWAQRPAPYHQYGVVIQSTHQILIESDGKSFSHYAFQLQPIPLTSSLLEAIGCVGNKNAFTLTKNNFTFLLQPAETGFYLWQLEPTRSLQLEQVRYVHQLQNLVEDITGIPMVMTQSDIDKWQSPATVLNTA
jgi:hypothetical protein